MPIPPTQIRFEVRGNPEHRHTAGVLCAKVARYPERTHHPERLLYPLRRIGPEGSGQFERVSWDQALSDIATRLQEINFLQPSRWHLTRQLSEN